MEEPYDVAIIGGGINGCGCAADAALRGLKVVLLEKSTIASHTSSASTKLIHGGLRYLEQYQFSLVRKSLKERQTLQKIAPNLVHPIQLIIPQNNHLRSNLMLRIGLFLYDHLYLANTLPKSRLTNRQKDPDYFLPLLPSLTQALSYYDGYTDDTRLTIANALQAKQHGATIKVQTTFSGATSQDGMWNLTIQTKNQKSESIQAKCLINATGQWVNETNKIFGTINPYQLSLVKGSHIIVNQLYKGTHGYVLQNQDKRIIFVLPFYGATLIGTTDIPIVSPCEDIKISDDEISYLLNNTNQYFNKKIKRESIIRSFSGVRTLQYEKDKSPSELSRDYSIHFSKVPAPYIDIYGGKITTYRILATQAIDKLKSIFPNLKNTRTDSIQLPSTISITEAHQIKQQYPWLEKSVLERYINVYGTQMNSILQGCKNMQDLGRAFSQQLFQREIDYLISEEWALNSDDILWKHTKMGLTVSQENQKLLDEYLL